MIAAAIRLMIGENSNRAAEATARFSVRTPKLIGSLLAWTMGSPATATRLFSRRRPFSEATMLTAAICKFVACIVRF